MHEDKRQSYRYPVQEGFRSSILKIGRQEYLVQLIEESAGGFSLSSSQPLSCKSGQVVLLQNSAGLFEGEVAHVTQNEDSTRVGLKRLGTLSQPKPPRSSGFASIFAGSRQRGGGGVVSLVIFALLGATIALFVAGGSLPWSAGAKKRSSAVSYQLPTVSPNGSLNRGLVGLNTLTSEDIAQRLGLSGTQRRNIQSIFRQTAQALSQAYEKSGGDSAAWEQESGELVEQAARSVVSSLTREQLARWSQILTEAPPAEPRP